ncbi:ABC transporter substrate-binding protein [Pseudonocardia spinosispora]|uniref:ABC transporter substrate-binding protein n=1 Tax=Pseudonocardia spinosispora TaxID=103441 RepID=UPI000413BC7D|nr:ABC transporter substrate-binding protein [Pseudonocardia spinosispora]
MPTRSLRLVAVLPVLLAVALTACAGPDPDQKPPPATGQNAINTSPDQHRIRGQKVEAIAASLPAAIRSKGTLVVGADGKGSPPLNFPADDDRTMIGVETDVAQLVADTLGLTLDLRQTSWANLFLAVDSGQYDAGFSNITVTEERKDSYDFATYRVDTVAFEAAKDSPIQQVTKPSDIAGRTVAVSAGTNQEQILLRWDAQNKAAGLAPAKLQYYTNPGDYYLALQSGRIDLYLGPNPNASYHVAVKGDTKIVGRVSGGGEITADIAAMTKKNNGLVGPLNEALNTVIKNGSYSQVLQRWNLTSEAIPVSQINPQGLPRT